jgi:hypothetical protein
MITDRRPARDKLRREYDSSHRLEKIRAPASANLAPLFGALEAARDAAAPELMRNVCTRFLASLSAFYSITSPSLKLLGPRPHSTYEGRLANELFGDYQIKVAASQSGETCSTLEASSVSSRRSSKLNPPCFNASLISWCTANRIALRRPSRAARSFFPFPY